MSGPAPHSVQGHLILFFPRASSPNSNAVHYTVHISPAGARAGHPFYHQDVAYSVVIVLVACMPCHSMLPHTRMHQKLQQTRADLGSYFDNLASPLEETSQAREAHGHCCPRPDFQNPDR